MELSDAANALAGKSVADADAINCWMKNCLRVFIGGWSSTSIAAPVGCSISSEANSTCCFLLHKVGGLVKADDRCWLQQIRSSAAAIASKPRSCLPLAIITTMLIS